MANLSGWNTLGNALAGGNEMTASLAEAQGESLGANTTNAIANANARIAKSKALENLPNVLRANPEFSGALGDTLAGAAQAGVNPQELYSSRKTDQETGLQARVADVNTPENATARALLALGHSGKLIEPVGTAGDVVDVTKQGTPGQYGQLPLGAELGQAHIAQEKASAAASTASAGLHSAQAAVVSGGGKPPTGMQWAVNEDGSPKFDANGQRVAAPITGGPADPDTQKPMSSTERRYFQTAMNAGTGAVSELNNVMRAPVGANAGTLGLGINGSKGHGVLDTVVSNIRNSLAPEDVQNYNAKINNLSRFMAIMENTGRMPPGSMVDMIDSMKLQPGDTEGTRLTKLAQLRQNANGALETWLQTAPLNSTAKAYVQKLQGQLATAIPFTVQDVDNWQQSVNPHQTIGDEARARLGIKAKGPPAGATPAAAAPGAPAAAAPGAAPLVFKTEAEAEDALTDADKGKAIIVNGRPATWQ